MHANSSPRDTRGAWWIVAILGLLYILSFVDRVILALLVEPLKRDLQISDVELGLLFGPAFAFFYAFLGIPVARFADKGNRTKLVVAGVLLWGTATILSGFAGVYWQLVVLRIGLAIGEAALTPAAYSLIGDLFSSKRRALAASIYSGMGMAGSAGGYILGAIVIGAIGDTQVLMGALHFAPWQLVFIIVGAPTIVVGLLFLLTVREPARTNAHEAAPGLGEVFGYLRRNATLYTGLFLGAGLTQAIGYAYSAWGAEVLRRKFEWTIQHAGMAYGWAALFAGFGGTIVAPIVTRALERAGDKAAVATTSIGALALGTALAVVAPLQNDPYLFLVVKAAASFCLVGASNNVLVALQALAPDRMRATLVALLLMSVTLLGLGIGPTATALASTHLNPDGGSLSLALAAIAPAIGIPALILLMTSRPALRRKTLEMATHTTS